MLINARKLFVHAKRSEWKWLAATIGIEEDRMIKAA